MQCSIIHCGSSWGALLVMRKPGEMDGRERPHLALVHKRFQQKKAAIYSTRQACEIKTYNIEEDVRSAEVAIDFGLRPVGLSSIGRSCPALEAGWILSHELERLEIPPTYEILSSETCNVVGAMYADALRILACISLARGMTIRRGPYRQLV